MPEDLREKPSPQRTATLRAVFVNMGWLLGGRGVAAILSLFYIAIVTRTLGVAGFGQFALIVGTAQMITGLVGFQTWQVIVRYGMAHIEEGRTESLTRLVKACLALDFFGSLAGAVLAVAMVLFLQAYFEFTDEVTLSALIVSLATLLAVRSTSTGILRLHDRFGAAAAADAALPSTRLLGALLALVIAPRLEAFLLAWSVAELVCSASFWAASVRHLRRLPWRRSPVSLALVREENPGIVEFAAVTNAIQTFALSRRQGAILLVGFLASPAAAGGFRLAHQLGLALAKVGQLLARALFPELVRARTLSLDTEHFKTLLARTIRLSALGGLIILLILFSAGRSLLELIAGPEFLPAYPLLVILGIAAIIDLVGVGFEPALIAAGKTKVLFRIQLIVTAFLVGLMVALLTRYGAMGGAAALLAASCASFLLLGVAVARIFRSRSPETAKVEVPLQPGEASRTEADAGVTR